VDGPIFLTVDEVLRLHDMQLDLYGGLPGLRDPDLLRSALAMPSTTSSGEFLHRDVFEMAAAYLFHLARDHPFADGNKRVALHAAYVFLALNGFRLEAEPGRLYEFTMAVASGQVGKSEVAATFRGASTLLR
jgi:death-on-curing protein